VDRALDGDGPALKQRSPAEPSDGFQAFLPTVPSRRRESPPEEARALWVTRWDFSSAEDVVRIVEQAAAAHFNILFFQVRGNADAFYASQFEPWARRLSGTLGQDPGWDPLEVAIEAAHSLDLELHAYINVYPAWVGTEPPPLVVPEPIYLEFGRLYGDDWIQWHCSGAPMPLNSSYLWANPGHWAVEDHVLDVALDIVSNYAVDGLHLDNVRYAGPDYSHDPVSTLLFASEQTINPSLTWGDWQRSQITRLVGRLHSAAGDLRPGLVSSGAVWPIYQDTWTWWTSSDGYDGYFQDSLGWLQAGQMDVICPMFYGSALSHYEGRFQDLLTDFVRRAGGEPVLAGISAEYDDLAPIERRIDMARALGAQGQAIFSARLIQQRDFWDEFGAGPYARSATVPQLASSTENR